MRITYRQLKIYLDQLSESQLDCDVTFEDEVGECFAAGFAVAGMGHGSLEENHPFIFWHNPNDESRFTDEDVADHIVSIRADDGFGEVG